MLLGGVFAANGTPQKLFATLSAAKAAHNARDLDRWAELFGVTLRMPAAHPLRTVEVLREVLGAAGHDVEQVFATIGRPEAKDDLRKRTDEAIALGIFGAPAFVVNDGHMYWGQDRMHFVERDLTGS